MTKTADNEQTLQSNEGADDNEPFVPSFEMDIPMGIKIVRLNSIFDFTVNTNNLN